jgi:xanthine dehydrogenase molybdenum-binding subunit
VKFNRSSGELKIREGKIICEHSGEAICTVEQIALEAYYSRGGAKVITSDVSVDVQSTANAFGVSAAEVEVDIRTGRVRILKICNVHDSGTVLNPMLAKGQVHGGMSMSLGMGLSEVMLLAKDGKPLNNNLLDYKLPTMMDTPEMGVEFVETYEPTVPFGNKALGEPPAISPAPAVRNAVLQATGVQVNETPMNPQRLFERFSEEGLI